MYVVPDRSDLPPIFRGRTYSLDFYLSDPDEANGRMNLTGKTLKMQLRTSPKLEASFVAEFEITITAPTDGEFTAALNRQATKSIQASRAYFDLIIIDGETENPYAYGGVDIEGSVTRNPYQFAPIESENLHMTDIAEAEVQ